MGCPVKVLMALAAIIMLFDIIKAHFIQMKKVIL